MENNTLKAGYAYVRVSTDKQEELSPDAQIRLIKEYAVRHSINLSEIFTEHGISGRKAEKRPEFMRMISQAKDKGNGINVILVWKYSRFARNQEESIVYKSLLKKQNNIDVISISEPLMDGPFGSLIERIIEWMDEYYSIRLSGEVLRGMTEKALRGGYQSRPPFGYRMEKGKIPIICPDEANTVHRVFEKYTNETMSAADIARWINDSGHRTTRGNLFDSRGIRYMLENPFYAGFLRWNHSSRARVLKEEADWVIVEGQHEPIIDRELYNKTQEALKKRLLPYKQHAVSSCKHWLSGLLICSSCGRTLSYNSAKNSGGYPMGFQCWGYSKGLCNDSHSLSERRAVQAVISGLEEYLTWDNICYTLAKSKEEGELNKAALLTTQLAENSRKMKRIKEAYGNGIDTLDEYRSNKSMLLHQQELLVKELNTLNNPPTKKRGEAKEMAILSVKDVLQILQDENIDYVKKGNALRSVCQNIIYDKSNDHMDFNINISL